MARPNNAKTMDRCVKVYDRLCNEKMVKISELADDMDVSYKTAYRWVESVGMVKDVRIERGKAIVGEE